MDQEFGEEVMDGDDEFSAEQWAEIQRRRAEYFQNPGSGLSWEDVLEKLLLRMAHFDDDGHLTEEQKAEIDRRLAEYDRDPRVAISWEEARAQLYLRLS